MLLHVFLVVASFSFNCIRIGSLILFLHYVPGIPIYSARIFVDTRFILINIDNYVMLLLVFGYLRLYCFPRVIIWSVLSESHQERLEYGEYGEYIYWGFVAALSLLLCLHVYWYYVFIMIGVGYARTGKTEDKVANLASMDSAKTGMKDKSE